MLIKAIDESMPVLEELDLSHVLQVVNTAKVTGTPAKKKVTDICKLLSGISMKL